MKESDIERAALQLIEEHGQDASMVAFELTAKTLEHQDYAGYAVWSLIWKAITSLERSDIS